MLLFLQLSRVLRLLKYPAEDSENPPQVNRNPLAFNVSASVTFLDSISAKCSVVNYVLIIGTLRFD